MDQQRLRELASQREESWAFLCFRYKTGQMRSQKTHIRQAKKKKRAEECAECGKVSRHSCGIRKGVKELSDKRPGVRVYSSILEHASFKRMNTERHTDPERGKERGRER